MEITRKDAVESFFLGHPSISTGMAPQSPADYNRQRNTITYPGKRIMIGKTEGNHAIMACSWDESHYYKFPSNYISYTVHSRYLTVTLLQFTHGKYSLLVHEGEVCVSSMSSKCDWSFTLEVVVMWAMECTVHVVLHIWTLIQCKNVVLQV